MLFRAIQGAGGTGGLPTYITYNSSVGNTSVTTNPSYGTQSIGDVPPSGYNRYVVLCAQGIIQNTTTTTDLTPTLGGTGNHVVAVIGAYNGTNNYKQYFTFGVNQINTGTTATLALDTSGYFTYGSGIGCYSVYVPVGKTMSYSTLDSQTTYNTGGDPTASLSAARGDVLFAIGSVRNVSPTVFSGDFTLDFSVDTQSSDGFGMGDLIPASSGTYTVTSVGVASSFEMAAVVKFIIS